MTPQEFQTIRKTVLKLNKTALSKALGIGRDSLANYERGTWPIPRVVELALNWLQYQASPDLF